MVECGVQRVADSEQWRRYLEVMGRFRHYSATNCLLILFQRPDATQVAGYKTWQKLGRQVRKGEHGISIWVPFRSSRKDTETEDEGEARPMYFGTGTVFDLAQTDGEPLPELCERLTGEVNAAHWVALAAYARGRGWTLDVRTMSVNGITGASGVILINESLAAQGALKTLCHEMAHQLLGHTGERKTVERERKELEAESVAYVTMAALGYDTSAYSLPYLTSWADGDAKKVGQAIAESASEIQCAAKTIIMAAQVEQEAEVAA